MTKKEVRCPNCRRKLCEADIIGVIEGVCYKCKKPFTFKDGIKK